MKLNVAGAVGVVVAMMAGALTTGCGPGFSHQGKWAKAPASAGAFASAAAHEQAAAAADGRVSTTTIASADVFLQLPATREPAVEPEPQVVETWGVAPPSAEDLEKYGF